MKNLSKVTQIIIRMAKVAGQAVDFKTHLLTFIPLCLPSNAMLGHSQPKAGPSPLTLPGSGFR